MASIIELIRHYLHKVPSGRFYSYFSKRINKTNIGMIVSLHSITRANESSQNGLNKFIELTDENLEKNILRLQKLDARFVTLQEVSDAIRDNKKFDKPIVHLSFDDGYRDNYQLAFPILKKYNVPFSIFVVSDFMDNKRPFLWWNIMAEIIERKLPLAFEKYEFGITEKDYLLSPAEKIYNRLRDFLLENIDHDREYFESSFTSICKACQIPETLRWQELDEMVKSGICEVGIHTKTHARFKNFSTERMEAEINACKEAIYDHTGVVSQWFAYSYGGKNDLADENLVHAAMKNCSIKLALTTVTGELNSSSDPYFLPRVFLNDMSTEYTLKTRLNGSYQRSRISGRN